jgi:phage shock protein E
VKRLLVLLAALLGITEFMDVRTPSEYAAGHIAGAINIDVEAPTFNVEIAKLEKNATYAVGGQVITS